ncbi:hypothetical protein V8E51_020021 [Hyaloscypha variabilis]
MADHVYKHPPRGAGSEFVATSVGIKTHTVEEYYELMQGDYVLIICGPSDIQTTFKASRKLLDTYSDTANMLLRLGDGKTLRIPDRWPSTVRAWLEIFHRSEPKIKRIIPIDESDGRSAALAAEYAIMEPRYEPATSLEQLVDLVTFADYMQTRSNDVCDFVADELEFRLTKLSDRRAITTKLIISLFNIPLKTSPIKPAWVVVAKAIAPRYAQIMFAETAEYRGYDDWPEDKFEHNEAIEACLEFRKLLTQMAFAFTHQDTNGEIVAYDDFLTRTSINMYHVS